ncbi:MAG: metalloregulator ArsR/SmtB family transcription factor [Deltaproteobacteria bacterium]|nr:metalloregulator ArsR/SmtB family transcription factor [Deltaproteobacteria bacterium]
MSVRKTPSSGSAADRSAAKRRIYEQFARIGKALGSATRLELLDLLSQGERSVEALAREASLEMASASQHLRALAAARLVETRREGQRIVYRIADPSVVALFHAVRAAAKAQLAELDSVAQAYLQREDDFEPIDQSELARRLRDGTVVLIDVRPPEEFAQGHIRGAINVPPGDVSAWAAKAPRKKEIVAYCRGPYCVYSMDAARTLRAKGLRVRALPDGVNEWGAAGRPVARTATHGGRS